MERILITGGAGFIGSNFINYIAKNISLIGNLQIVVLDKLTYAANLNNINIDLIKKNKIDYHFITGDICDVKIVKNIFDKYEIDCVINFAAETHVDNSIKDPNIFLTTNVNGAVNLMNCALNYWKDKKYCRFIQISTDEVYGSLPFISTNKFTENSSISPNNPYSASKAAADLFAMAYYNTYSFPAIVTRCSNNYGVNQFSEKLIPLMIERSINNKHLPIYGNGLNIRDWIYVEDHCSALLSVLINGNIGEVYNIGANCEKNNLEVVKIILDLLNKPHSLIEFVNDRLGHDEHYAIDASKIKNELAWEPKYNFEDGIRIVIENKKTQ